MAHLRKVKDIIKAWGYDVASEYKPEGCVYKKALSFDVYLPQINVLVEYDGEQHYKPIPYFKSDNKGPEDAYHDRVIRDEIKNKYCRDNNIPLIRISYWEKNNLESYMKEKFAELDIRISTWTVETDRPIQ